MAKREIELKFEVASAELGMDLLMAIVDRIQLIPEPTVTKVLLSRYLDNVAGSLARCGAGFRARGELGGEVAIWTMKLAESQAGARFTAAEYEVEGGWCEVPGEFGEAVADLGGLVEIARLSNRRLKVDASRGAVRVEAVVDLVTVEHPRVMSFAEVEFESSSTEILTEISREVAAFGGGSTPSRGHKLSRALGNTTEVDAIAARKLAKALERGVGGGTRPSIRSPWCR